MAGTRDQPSAALAQSTRSCQLSGWLDINRHDLLSVARMAITSKGRILDSTKRRNRDQMAAAATRAEWLGPPCAMNVLSIIHTSWVAPGTKGAPPGSHYTRLVVAMKNDIVYWRSCVFSPLHGRIHTQPVCARSAPPALSGHLVARGWLYAVSVTSTTPGKIPRPAAEHRL